ncbi:MAG TPA: TIGR03943 family protein, partial [Glaciihabitans sp.]|nr:TIGR03943 family protein [Glaciihabitans sp.]
AENASEGAFATFTVLDWASLLRQTSDTAFYADKPVDVTGFITEDADDPDNVFYVSRFVITCCAVDAQPVGVPVYMPGWRDEMALDDWVQLTGQFVANPSTSSAQQIALAPESVTPVGEPSEPYLF